MARSRSAILAARCVAISKPAKPKIVAITKVLRTISRRLLHADCPKGARGGTRVTFASGAAGSGAEGSGAAGSGAAGSSAA